MVRANFDYYSKNSLDYTDIDAGFDEGGFMSLMTVNEVIRDYSITPVAGSIFHSGEKAAKIALQKLRKFR